MTGARPADILRQLEEPAQTDRDLLARFVRERDQSAFRELVIRHGPVVLAVCRRVTCHRQDAEDAFQAVFLILARKASSIRKPEVLGSWLHGVALRVAQTRLRKLTKEEFQDCVDRITEIFAGCERDKVKSVIGVGIGNFFLTRLRQLQEIELEDVDDPYYWAPFVLTGDGFQVLWPESKK